MKKREIKFRFWSKHLKHFVKPNDDIFVGALKDRNMAVMQFTGLLDKNGKEIYEGDIVKYKVFERFRDNKSEEISEVEYTAIKNNRVGFTPMVWHTNVEDGFYNYEIEDIEVIGNIYENPELLK